MQLVKKVWRDTGEDVTVREVHQNGLFGCNPWCVNSSLLIPTAASAAIVWFRLVLGPNFSTLNLTSSGSANWSYLGLDHPEPFNVVRFRFMMVRPLNHHINSFYSPKKVNRTGKCLPPYWCSSLPFAKLPCQKSSQSQAKDADIGCQKCINIIPEDKMRKSENWKYFEGLQSIDGNNRHHPFDAVELCPSDKPQEHADSLQAINLGNHESRPGGDMIQKTSKCLCRCEIGLSKIMTYIDTYWLLQKNTITICLQSYSQQHDYSRIWYNYIMMITYNMMPVFNHNIIGHLGIQFGTCQSTSQF